MKKGLLVIAVLCFLVSALSVFADADEKKIGDESDGSRAVAVHLIELFDEEGDKISPDDDPLLPFSARKTCCECHIYEHNYEIIGKAGILMRLMLTLLPVGLASRGFLLTLVLVRRFLSLIVRGRERSGLCRSA
ncbi:MAG TPA: hypothetical protein HPP66_14145 [Planctomycetes bacterium]|nr:hypothetical protein [Planctomycetota bacterium]